MAGKIIRELENGLIIRRSTLEDSDALVKFNVNIHQEGEWDAKGLEDWTLDLISGEGPTFDTGDFTLVEDTKTGEIVSSCCLISQTWSYEGIPYYYRRFGYEMTLNLSGGRAGYDMHLPDLKEDEKEPYTLRPAVEADIPFLMLTYENGFARSMINALWDESLWRYELTGKRKYNINRRDLFVIEDQGGNPAGFLGTPPIKWGKMSVATLYELAPGHAWTAVTPSVIRFLWERGARLGEEQDQEQKMFGFWLGESHPVYEAVVTKLPRVRKPYSYFMRVSDLPAFLELIKPVLERRLAESAFASHSGELKLNFYKDGLKMELENGLIETIEALAFEDPESSSASFPDLTFLHLVFGHRSMGELKYAFTDCLTKDDETEHLLDALFPKQPSEIWAVS